MHLYEVLRRPLITEKNTSVLHGLNKYAFEVADDANKPQVKQAVEKAFKVDVTNVNIMWVRGKAKRVGSKITMTPSWKKAVVTIKDGDRIEFFEGI
ncbi:50S ribosomal protein L23 [Chloroflexota bacterium]